MVLMMICGSIGFVSCNDEDIVTADDESLRSYELITLQELSGYGSICIWEQCFSPDGAGGDRKQSPGNPGTAGKDKIKEEVFIIYYSAFTLK